ncbi:acyltransferase family protein [Tellurirhabdus rosea]|uniref:acyltransferase family protein n=1 Tax=Tellurirhabdus rosea TaxID=2674997 RepID=UPI00225133DA|nr:acyltransferase family protein [Tellurirhabdus rosea]
MQPILQQTPAAGPQTGPSPRRYDLDWLRVIAIVILLFYHTGMIYVSWGWHIQSRETSPLLEDVMRWLHHWRMPLLFFISGAGTYYALRKRTYGAYAGERFRRLFIPLVFGMFVIVPPQIYFEWLFRGRFSGSYADFYPNVFGFEPYHDGGTGGAFSWHHLWFVAYLFLYSLLTIPFAKFIRSGTGQRLVDRVGRLVRQPGGVMLLVLLFIVNDLTLGHFWPEETHDLRNDWAYFVANLLLFWTGYVLVSRPNFAGELTQQRRILGIATLFCTILLYTLRALADRYPELEENLMANLLYDANENCLMWFSVLATVAYGHRYLNVNRPILPHLTEAVYPFYILHQTVIVAIGFYLLRANLGILGGYLTVSLLSLLTSVGIYLLLIRPFRLIRPLFGLK